MTFRRACGVSCRGPSGPPFVVDLYRSYRRTCPLQSGSLSPCQRTTCQVFGLDDNSNFNCSALKSPYPRLPFDPAEEKSRLRTSSASTCLPRRYTEHFSADFEGINPSVWYQVADVGRGVTFPPRCVHCSESLFVLFFFFLCVTTFDAYFLLNGEGNVSLVCL